jgi:Lysophospholipase L1 and related esterases
MNINLNHSNKKDDGFIFKVIAIMFVLVAIIVAVMFFSAPKDENKASSDTDATVTDVTNEAPPIQNQDAATPDALSSEAGILDDSMISDYTENEVITLDEADYSDTILLETDDMGQEYIDTIMFFGDSTTYGLKPYAMLAGGRDTMQVWAPISGTLSLDKASMAKIYYPETGEEITVKEAMQAKKPAILIITLGVNGISYMDEDTFKTYYKKLVEEMKAASPSTKIILQSIFPVSTLWEQTDSINNDKIDAANVWVLQIAKDCGVKYLQTATALKDDTGFLPISYQNSGDGMHLNTAGFTALLQYIKTHAYVDKTIENEG